MLIARASRCAVASRRAAASSRRAPDPRRAVARRFSSSEDGYYDSQSGVFVSTAATLRIFDHSARAGASSGAVHVVAPVDASSGTVARVVGAADVAAAARVGAVAVRIDCSVADRSEASAVAAAASEHGLAFDVGFSDAAADVDHVAAELVVGELADLGVRGLLFKVSSDDIDDDDDLREVFSAVGGVDAPGVPIRRRLGLSASEDVDVEALAALASSLDVHMFDASTEGCGYPATGELLFALESGVN